MKYADLLNVLLEKHYSLSCMESLTGGLFASTFTSIPGASQAFHGGAITYTDEVKESFGVKKETIDTYGAVSKECVKEMAINASSFFHSNCAVSFSGNAGPSASENKPVGLVYIGIKIESHVQVYELHLSGNRDEIRKQCVDFAFSQLMQLLNS